MNPFNRFPVVKHAVLTLVTALLFSAVPGCSDSRQNTDNSVEKQSTKPVIVFAGASWDSITLHNSIAKYIVENGYGYPTAVTTSKSEALHEALRTGDVDVHMEYWIYDSAAYAQQIKKGEIVELGTIFDDNREGFFVPAYVVKGDAARGIRPMAPGLRSVTDLPKYASVFQDPANPGKGIFSGGVTSWTVEPVIEKKFAAYGLNQSYVLKQHDSDKALENSILEAVKTGKPWVGYYWQPTNLMGTYSFIQLKEPKHDAKVWQTSGRCEFPVTRVAIAITPNLRERAPEVVSFLSRFHMTSALTSEALADLKENNVNPDQEAQLFLKRHPEVWKKWVSPDAVSRVEKALRGGK
ncbi:MAG: ABC transporter substrate-binding protein [Solirubrobacterales bacterium]